MEKQQRQAAERIVAPSYSLIEMRLIGWYMTSLVALRTGGLEAYPGLSCDCAVLRVYDITHLKQPDVRTQYARLPEQDVAIFDCFIATAKRLYPEYSAAIDKLEHGSVQYLCNMFVMRKELFFEYSEFCFNVLRTVDKQIDSRGKSKAALRFLGYLGEFCLTLYIFHLQARGDHRIKELDGTFIIADEAVQHPKRKYWYYKLLAKITWGKRRQQYKEKRRMMKYLIKTMV